MCSGAIARHFYEGKGYTKDKNLKLYPINYEDSFPWDDIQKEDTVVMVDFSLQAAGDMGKLSQMCELIWIDHHKSALAELKDLKVGGVRDTNFAGCELTWKFFFHDVKLPKFVFLLGRYDIWDMSDKALWDSHILPFQFGMKAYETRPEVDGNILSRLVYVQDYDKFVEETVALGHKIQKYQQGMDKGYAEEMAYDVEFDGLKCVAMNLRGNSNTFKSVYDEKKHDAMLMYFYTNKGVYTVSLYTTKKDVDCSKIAKKHGGGGHAQAAGFQTKEIPWLKEKIVASKGKWV